MINEPDYDIDTVLQHAGNFGRYQILLMVLFSFINVTSAFHYFGQTFISVLPKFECDTEDRQGVVQSGQCDVVFSKNGTNQSVECDTRWTYETEELYGFVGIVQELNWVCQDDWKPILGQSVFFIGSVIGSLSLGYLADWIGRLHVLVIANLFALIGNVFTALSRNITLYAASRFLAGCATDANFFMMYIIVMEYIKPSLRTMGINLTTGVFYCIGCVVIPWFAVLLGNWKSLMFFVGLPHILIIGFYFLVTESAQWLISQGQMDRAIGCFKRVAAVNGNVVEEKVFDALKKYYSERIPSNRKNDNFLGLLKTKNLRRKTLILIFKSMVMTLCYDAISRNINGLGYPPFAFFSISSVTILPSCLLILAVQDKIGRKALASLSFFVGGVVAVSSGMSQILMSSPQPAVLITLAIIARLCITVAYNSGAQYAVELIPTVVRGQGVSLIHVLGYAASFFSPQVLYLSSVWKPAPDVIIGLLMVSGAMACLFLPETLDRVLPVSLQDGEAFGENEKIFEFSFSKLKGTSESTTQLYGDHKAYT